MKLDVRAFAVASSIVSGTVSLLLALFSVFTGQGRQLFEILAPFHPLGYAPTISGAVIGAIWMVIYGLIMGAMLAYLYNRFAEK
jgi:hypothetical protein